MDEDKIERLARVLKENKDVNIKDPRVEIAKIRLDGVRALADENNPIFSELQRPIQTKYTLVDETFDIAVAMTFARKPLRGLEERLAANGYKIKKIENGIEIEEKIEIRIESLELFIIELLKKRHSSNRMRVKEYIDALENISDRQPLQQRNFEEERTLLRRIV